MNSTNERNCLTCDEKITGRVDKRFCCDQCRVAFNNRLNGKNNNYIRNINNILKRNRRILSELKTREKCLVNINELALRGFNFIHYTSAEKTSKGEQYYYCYEFGYKILNKNQLSLVLKKIR